MRNLIKYIFIISFGCLCMSTTYVYAQESAPSFQSLMSSGDKEYAKKEYIKAKTYYQQALRLKPKDATAKSKLDNTLLKIKEENKKEETFFEYIDNADSYYANSELEKALEEYNKALKIFPKDEYATNKKAEITTILKDEKDKLDSFNAMITLGDKLLSSEKYAEAVMQYESALAVYPNNSLAKTKYQDAKNKKEAYDLKVSEFERLQSQGRDFTLRKKYTEAIAAYEQALQIFPKETEISDIIKELQTKKNIADNYNAKITEADALYEDQSYKDAKSAYQAALTVIPDDSYALGMIARIDEIVNSPEYLKIQNDKAKLDNDFAGFMNKGENAEGVKNYELALSYYVKALELKPNNAEALAKKKNAEDMILYLEQQRKEQERLVAIEAEKQRKAQIQTLIATGNQQIADKKYAEAEQSFNQVLAIDPNNATATEKLGVIAGFYEEIQRQKQENYNRAMSEGSYAMDSRNFAEAINQFNIALTYKPGDEAATQQLTLAQQNENMRLAALENEYNGYITKGDAQLQTKNYDKAIEFYTKAMQVNPSNPYPGNKIREIGEILKANKLVELVSSATTINSSDTKRYEFTSVDAASRRGNYLLIKAKNLGDRPFIMYISYGSKNGRNGGFTVNVPNNQDVNDFIVRIGSQYKWFSEDNTWIEILPENGNIEITSMEITKGN
ncbi:MAG: tetratricopeptide repeat protein [Bacteroidales bacterium]|nr:tetratricopeptide repeat protein [Bacteroidales bacterium]